MSLTSTRYSSQLMDFHSSCSWNGRSPHDAPGTTAYCAFHLWHFSVFCASLQVK